MHDNYTPTKYLLLIQKIKYKFFLFPAIIVLGSLILSFYSPQSYLKFTSLFGLLCYFFILFIFRINRIYSLPDNKGAILSPINGKVLKIDEKERKIFLKKSFLQNCEIRNPSSSISDSLKFDKKFYSFNFNSQLKGEIMGIYLGTGNCSFSIPQNYMIKVSSGDKVLAGNTIIAEPEILIENNDE